MALPVVEAANGLPVTVADNGIGVPMVIAENGIGLPVTIVESGGLPVTGLASGPLVPAAPLLSVVEPVTNPPAFDVDLPSGNGNYLDAAVGDTLRLQVTLATDTGFAAVEDEATVVLDSDDLTADVIEVAGLETLDAASTIARARLERPDVGNSAWSATTAPFEVPPAVTKSYTFKEIWSEQDYEFTAVTRPIDLSDAAADRVVIVGASCFNNAPVASVLAAGTALEFVGTATSSNGTSEIWAGVVPSGSGVQNVVTTWTGAAYLTRSVATWVASGLSSAVAADTAANEADISVEAGDFLFVMAMSAFGDTAPSLGDYTQPPTEHTIDSGNFAFTAGDATIVSTNAAFVTSVPGSPYGIIAAVFR